MFDVESVSVAEADDGPLVSEMLPQPDQVCTALAVNLAHEDSILLAGILRNSRWRLQEVRTCQEALQFAQNGPLPVVLCERHMADGNWDILINKLRELAAPPAVIVVSRFADEHLWIDVLALGGHDVLATPFDRSELFRVLFLAWMASKPAIEHKPVGLQKAPAIEEAATSPKWLCASSER